MDGPVCVCVFICASVCHKPAFCPNGYACVITQTRHRIYCSCIWHEISWWNSAGVTPSRREKHTPVKKQVWVQLPASADNVGLPAFAAARRAAVQQSIDISCPLGPQQQTRNVTFWVSTFLELAEVEGSYRAKTSLIRSAASIELRLMTDRQTDIARHSVARVKLSDNKAT